MEQWARGDAQLRTSPEVTTPTNQSLSNPRPAILSSAPAEPACFGRGLLPGSPQVRHRLTQPWNAQIDPRRLTRQVPEGSYSAHVWKSWTAAGPSGRALRGASQPLWRLRKESAHRASSHTGPAAHPTEDAYIDQESHNARTSWETACGLQMALSSSRHAEELTLYLVGSSLMLLRS